MKSTHEAQEAPLKTKSGKTAAYVKTDEHGRKYSERAIDPDKHIFQKENAVCYDDSVLDEAKEREIEYHVIKVKRKKFYATPDNFKDKGIAVRFPGREPQTGLCLDDWEEGEAPPFREEKSEEKEGGDGKAA